MVAEGNGGGVDIVGLVQLALTSGWAAWVITVVGFVALIAMGWLVPISQVRLWQRVAEKALEAQERQAEAARVSLSAASLSTQVVRSFQEVTAVEQTALVQGDDHS